MNRNLRRLALVGLLALGASSAGAQTLFNLTYNPSQYQLTITPTGAAASSSVSGITFLPEYGLLFGSFFRADPLAILPNDYKLPTSGFSGSGIVSTAGSGTAMNNVYSDMVDRYDFNVASLGAGTMTFASSGAAFSSAPLTITFSSSVDQFMRTSNFSGGLVSAFSSTSVEHSLGTYNYSVVPEPSTYAAIAGALGLAYAVYRRRRQAAAATASA